MIRRLEGLLGLHVEKQNAIKEVMSFSPLSVDEFEWRAQCVQPIPEARDGVTQQKPDRAKSVQREGHLNPALKPAPTKALSFKFSLLHLRPAF